MISETNLKKLCFLCKIWRKFPLLEMFKLKNWLPTRNRIAWFQRRKFAKLRCMCLYKGSFKIRTFQCTFSSFKVKTRFVKARQYQGWNYWEMFCWIGWWLQSRKFYIRRNNSKVDSMETRPIAHLLPWSDLEKCMYVTLF